MTTNPATRTRCAIYLRVSQEAQAGKAAKKVKAVNAGHGIPGPAVGTAVAGTGRLPCAVAEAVVAVAIPRPALGPSLAESAAGCAAPPAGPNRWWGLRMSPGIAVQLQQRAEVRQSAQLSLRWTAPVTARAALGIPFVSGVVNSKWE